MNILINNQLVFFPNGQGMIDDFIIQSVDLLDSSIINNEITIYKMPEIQLLDIILEHDEFFSNLKYD